MWHVECPECAKPLKVASDRAGKSIRCPGCKHVWTLPDHAGGEPSAIQTAPVRTPPKSGPEASRRAPPAGRAGKEYDPDEDDRDGDREDDRDDERGYDDDEAPSARRRRQGRRRPVDAREPRGKLVWILAAATVLPGVAILGVVGYFLIKGDGTQPAPPVAEGARPPGLAIPPPPPPPPLNRGAPVGPAPVQPPPAAAPANVDPETVQRVKRATVYLRVTLRTGHVSEGTGFLALEPGLVLTNAHVVGMKNSDQPPSSVQVSIHSGEPEEMRLNAQVLGADGSRDLALLRITGAPGRLPEPLPLESAATLTELQKVYIFGFPFGANLGKNITVSESSVSSLRKDATGAITQVQVNGGMHQGNSGGPVVDSRGVVVGVAVAIIQGTQINFAVPSDHVTHLTEGRVRDLDVGVAYSEGDAVKLPVRVACLDPLARLTDVQLEMWTGQPGPARPDGQAVAYPGDGPRQTVNLEYKNGSAQAVIDVPALEAGTALWLQPIAVRPQDVRAPGTAVTVADAVRQPVQRAPTTFRLSHAEHPERTLRIKNSRVVKIVKDNQPQTIGQVLDANLLEVLDAKPGGINVALHAGDIRSQRVVAGKTLPNFNTHPQEIVKKLPFMFALESRGGLRMRHHPGELQRLPLPWRFLCEDLFNTIANGFEATSLTVPQRDMKPHETWTAQTPLLATVKGIIQMADLKVTCRYEGRRQEDGRAVAFIGVSGHIYARNPLTPAAAGRVRGYLVFDLDRGLVAEAALTILSEAGAGPMVVYSESTYELTRDVGNPHKIARLKPGTPLPIDPSLIAPVAKGKVLLDVQGTVMMGDPVAKLAPFGRFKVHTIALKAGVRYVIEMGGAVPLQFDPFLRLEDAKGQELAVDDDSGGNLNSRIVYTPKTDGDYRIIATVFEPQQLGAYTLTVAEAK
ncbi:MAG: trypsin-like peptidase domain-containing protein [Gemmataceae bacterium]|nr:trypsin-like peptidase domain-containing protein [Gemmataceae bacterium]